MGIIPCWGNGMAHRFRSRFVPDGFAESTGPIPIGLQILKKGEQPARKIR